MLKDMSSGTDVLSPYIVYKVHMCSTLREPATVTSVFTLYVKFVDFIISSEYDCLIVTRKSLRAKFFN